MIKSLKVVAIAIAVSATILGGNPASAAGQIEGGNIYRVKNVTKNSAFADPASATCGETVQFRVRIHNPGPGEISNVKVAATLPAAEATSHSSTVTVSASDAPDVITDTAGVNLDKAGKLSYVAGSTELLDPSGAKLQGLGDGIVGGGVTLSDPIGVSTQQFRSVQFSAKVDCPEKPVCTQNCTPVTPPKTPTPSTPAVTPSAIPSTGPEALLGGLTGVSALGYVVSRFIQSRRER